MEFKNETGENAKYRLGSVKSGYDWYSLKPGDTADIPEHIGVELKLTRVEEEPEEVSEVLNNEPSEEDPTDADATFQEDTDQEAAEAYKKKLIDIDGIGKKTAEDIMAKYPTEEVLKLAINNGDEIHKRDDVDEAVKETFGE